MQQTYNRYQHLALQQDIAQQVLDKASAELTVANAKVTEAQKALEIIKQKILVQQAQINNLANALAFARYQLSLTTIFAPATGYINHLRTYAGDYAQKGNPVFGLVVTKRFRIITNYKEYVVARLKPGQRVWIYLSTYPWQLWHGHVVSTGLAVAREATPPNATLPYIQPVTDWIRYPYRFPVTIAFDPPLPEKLHMGADAKTLVFLP